jgi:pyruvate,water dikinase
MTRSESEGEDVVADNGLVFWFTEIDRKDNEAVGKKGANLGEMVNLGMPVAPGFALVLDGFRAFLSTTGAGEEISKYLKDLGEIENISKCDEASRAIRSIVEGKEMPEDMRKQISSCYRRLCKETGTTDVPVSVRSSGATSRPGMFDTLLNVRGEKDVLQAVKKVWASTFSSRAHWYRIVHGIASDADMLGVVVQQFVNSLASGIMFCADPVSGDTSRIVVEATWGLGEGAVGGKVKVDQFVLDKDTLEITQRTIADKPVCICASEHGVEESRVDGDKRTVSCLSDEELKVLGGLAKFLEEKLSEPQDIEWAIDPEKRIRLYQTRPVKVTAEKDQAPAERIASILAERFK